MIVTLFNFSQCYFADLIIFNNNRFMYFISDIYPNKLTIFETQSLFLLPLVLTCFVQEMRTIKVRPNLMKNVIFAAILSPSLSEFHCFFKVRRICVIFWYDHANNGEGVNNNGKGTKFGTGEADIMSNWGNF